MRRCAGGVGRGRPRAPACRARKSSQRSRQRAQRRRALRRQRQQQQIVVGGRCAGAGAARGASSTITWALVPPTPNELTPAQRGCAPRGHGVSAVGIASRVPSSEMCGLSCGEVHLRRNRLVLQRQHGLDQAGHAGGGFEMADVGLQPTPSRHGAGAGAGCPTVAAIASTSIGSPSAVPVPCVSTKPMRAGSSCALRQRLAEQRLLRRAVRRGQHGRVAVLVDRGAADHARARGRHRRWHRPGA